MKLEIEEADRKKAEQEFLAAAKIRRQGFYAEDDLMLEDEIVQQYSG